MNCASASGSRCRNLNRAVSRTIISRNGNISAMNSKHLSAVEQFQALHESDCFVLPNPWDAGSAIYLEHAGFKALATTSAGFAFSQGLPDGADGVSRGMMLEHFREIAAATS